MNQLEIAITLISQAKFQYYSCMNPSASLALLTNANSLLGDIALDNNTAAINLDSLTLTQSVCASLHDMKTYLNIEERLKPVFDCFFGNRSADYYSVHLFDVADILLTNHDYKLSLIYYGIAVSMFTSSNGECDYLDFVKHFYQAHDLYEAERYYDCIEIATRLNTMWYENGSESYIPPFLEVNAQSVATIDSLGFLNLLFLFNSYIKINDSERCINPLKEILTLDGLTPIQRTAAEITLAAAYATLSEYDKALPIYEKYKSQNFTAHPDLFASMSSLSYLLDKRPFTLPTVTKDASGQVLSHNAINVSQYNYALSLYQSGNLQEALNYFEQLGGMGYSMVAKILVKLNRLDSLALKYHEITSYFYRQIEQIYIHYNDRQAYQHLTQLQFHIAIVIAAFSKCVLDESCNFDTSSLYEFVQNTKYVSYDAEKDINTIEPNPGLNVKLGSIQKKLNDSALLLEYIQIDDDDESSYGAFVVSKKDINFYKLDSVNITDELILEWSENVSDITNDASKRYSVEQKLRRILYLPIKDTLSNAKQLIVAPVGRLLSFPFSCLSFATGKYLADIMDITYCNQGKELIYAEDYMANGPVNALVTGAPETVKYSQLPSALMECEHIANKLGCQALTGIDFSVSLFNNNFNAPKLWHIASHGIFGANDSNETWDSVYNTMLNSGIVLSNDELLSASNIEKLDLNNTALAVVSCCHSGEIQVNHTEGLYGLRRAFKLAGCKNIILNLWRVDDDFSMLFTKEFYRLLLDERMSSQDSFFKAIEYVKNYTVDGHCIYSHPYYWAGFIYLN